MGLEVGTGRNDLEKNNLEKVMSKLFFDLIYGYPFMGLNMDPVHTVLQTPRCYLHIQLIAYPNTSNTGYYPLTPT